MRTKAGFQEHWITIEPERLKRYETMYAWTEAAEAFYAPAGIGPGHIVADFGCGPGHASVEFAKRVGSSGHIHALDINAEFIRRASARAESANVADRLSTHLLTGAGLPLDNESLDRVVARNTLIYVDDPVATLREFRRCLRSEGLALAIEGDWRLTLVEPVPSAEWTALVEAASWAWPHPEIGRGLFGMARAAGFSDVAVDVQVHPDTNGRLLGMIKTVAGYAGESGEMDPARIVRLIATVERAIVEGKYLAVSPQFVVSASG